MCIETRVHWYCVLDIVMRVAFVVNTRNSFIIALDMSVLRA